MSKDAKPDAWMPLYTADWDADTRHLSCEEDGAYGRLVRHYWRNGPLPNDDTQLSRIVGMSLQRWRKVRQVIAPFFRVTKDRWNHKRVDAEVEKWTEKRRRAIERAAAGGRAKASKGLLKADDKQPASSPQAVLKGCTSSSSSSSEVDALNGQSTLRGRERPEARHEGASGLRVIEGGVSDRDAWDVAYRQALTDYEHFQHTDPDFASEIGEFIAVAQQRLAELEAVA